MEIRINIYGGTIDDAVDKLQKSAKDFRDVLYRYSATDKNIITTMEFNGAILTSDDSLDEAYVKVTGKTKAEIDEEDRRWREEYQRKEREWKESIPSRVQPYCDMARDVIREDKYEYWDKIVPIRLGDIYHGMELGCTLDILREWNKSASYKKCHEIILSQGHSGMSHGLVVAMIREFARGEGAMVDKLVRTLDKVEYDKNA